MFFDRCDLAAGDDLDAVLFHVLAHMGPNFVVEAAQNILAAINQRHVRSEAGENSGKLNGNITTALDHHMLGQMRQVECFVRGDGVLDAWNRIAVAWRAAGGDQDISRTHTLAVRQLYRMRVGDDGAGFDNGDP